MKMCIKLFSIVFIFIIACVFSGHAFVRNSNLNPPANISIDSISKIQINRLTNYKIVTDIADIEKIVAFLNSFEYRKSSKQSMNGWVYDVRIIDKSNRMVYSRCIAFGEEIAAVFSSDGDKGEGTSYYSNSRNNIEGLDKIYDSIKCQEKTNLVKIY